MPIFRFECEAGHGVDVFEHARDDLGCRTFICATCHHTMVPVLSVGRGLTYFSEKTPRLIRNLGDKPMTIRSHGEHVRAMKAAGVEWHPPKRGMPGCWGG